MKKLSIILLVAIITISNMPVFGQIQNSEQAIKIVEMQMLFTQKLAKDFLIIGINCCESTTSKAKTELKETSVQYLINHKDLISYINSHQEKLETEAQNISMYCQLYTDILNSSPDVYCASTLIEINNDLMQEYDDVLIKLKENSTENKEHDIINICKKQSILSQHIAVLYIGKTWGIEGDKNIKKEYAKSRGEFKKYLKTISLNGDNTEDINNNIHSAKNLFGFDKKEFDVQDNEIAEIFDITNKLDKKMEDIAEMYLELYNN